MIENKSENEYKPSLAKLMNNAALNGCKKQKQKDMNSPFTSCQQEMEFKLKCYHAIDISKVDDVLDAAKELFKWISTEFIDLPVNNTSDAAV